MNFTFQEVLRLADTQKLTATTSAATFYGDECSYLIHNTSDVTVYLEFGEKTVIDATTDSMELRAGDYITVRVNRMSYYAASSAVLKLAEIMNVG